MLARMKHTLIVFAVLALSACSTLPMQGQDTNVGTVVASNLSHWPGDYDNHAQVWQAQQDKLALMPVRVRHHIAPVAKANTQWDWRLRMGQEKGDPIEANWRYTLRTLEDGTLLLTPQRALPVGKDQAQQWANLAPCAMRGNAGKRPLSFVADSAACSAILPGLGASAALLPLRMTLTGDGMDVATYADQARGDNAVEHASRVRWFDGWVVINGGGPDAKADNNDWHMHRDLHISDQGGVSAIRWRDGQPSGYSLKLERLKFQQRDTEVLKLSLIRDSGGGAVAYAWANPDARQIGLSLGWMQTGLDLQQADASASK